jgi:hypothetical protein
MDCSKRQELKLEKVFFVMELETFIGRQYSESITFSSDLLYELTGVCSDK